MNDSPDVAGDTGNGAPARRGLTCALAGVLVLAILALLAIIGYQLLAAPGSQVAWQDLQLSLGGLSENGFPFGVAPSATPAAGGCPEASVLAYENKAAVLNEQASQSAAAAYTAYTRLIQVQVAYCLVTLKSHHVKLFYARYMAARAVESRNSAEAARYAEEVVRYIDLATQERDRLEARYGWTQYK